MKVYIAQLKCPNNHCILAAAAEFETWEAAQDLRSRVEGAFQELLDSKAVNNECSLCRSSEFHVDINPTGFRSMEEARPYLMDEEQRQVLTAAYLKQSRN